MLESTQQLGRIFAIIGCFLALGHSTSALALGFGDIRLASGLNAPLDARIELVSLSESERRSLSVQVAPQALFERFGIERTAFADEVIIDVMEGRASNSVVLHLTTRRAVREPFLRFLLEADTAEGRALREYTVLLDPPGRMPVAANNGAQAASTPAPVLAAGSDSGRRQARSSTNTPVRRYGPVRPGDTLYSIAEQLQRPDTTLDQMQVAIFRDNPQAFNDNINRLFRGAVLSIPAREKIAAIDRERASSLVRQQRQVAVSAPPPASPKPDEGDEGDEASVAKSTAGEGDTRARLRLVAPQVTPSKEQGEPVSAPDHHFGRLVEPDFTAFAQDRARQGFANDGGVTPASSEAQPLKVALNDEETDAAAQDGAHRNPAIPKDASEKARADDTFPGRADHSIPLEASSEQDVAPHGDGGLLSPRNLLLLVLIVLLFVAVLLWYRRRQYKPVPLDFSTAAEEETTLGAAASNHVEPTQAVPESAPPSAADTSGTSQSSKPEVVIADADQKIKSGLFDQARTSLNEGLRRYPEHAGLQDKRLELDYLADDAEQFARSVDRFHHALATNGVRWAGIAAMGRLLLPGDPRFAVDAGERAAVEQTPATSADEERSAHDRPADSPISPTTRPDPIALSQHESSYLQQDTGETSDFVEAPATPQRSAEAIDALAEPDEQRQDEEAVQSDRDEDDGALRLDTTTTDLDTYEWQAQEVPDGEERAHDQGEDSGLSFDLDMTEFPDHVGPRAIDESSGGARVGGISGPASIDADDYDLGESDSAASEEHGTDGDPVDIRLDLARMYLDMEDHEAARDLLEEALAEGNDEQQAIARTLLDQYSR